MHLRHSCLRMDKEVSMQLRVGVPYVKSRSVLTSLSFVHVSIGNSEDELFQ